MRLFLGLVLALSLLTPAVRAEPKPKAKPTPTPALVLRLSSLDNLIATGKQLAKLADQEDLFKQVEGLLKSQTGPKGLEGIDTKKPIGAYAYLDAKLPRSQFAIMLPIADEKTFLKFLDGLDFKVEKGKDGLHKVTIENVPVPLLFRIANGYLYGTAQIPGGVGLPKDKLPLPATILPAKGPLLSLSTNLDGIPEQVRKLALTFISTQLADQKDNIPENETKAQKALREAILDEAGDVVKMLLTEGKSLTVKLDHDAKTKELSLALDLGGKGDTTLAKNIAAMGKVKSIGAALVGTDSVMGGFATLVLPKRITKALAGVVGELKGQLAKEEDKDKKAAGQAVIKAIEPLIKDGQIDLGIDLRGPGKGGKYTLVAGGKVADGAAIESAIKKVVSVLPEDARKAIKTDVAKADGVNLHTLTPDKVDDNTKKLFGDGPIYLAFTKGAALAAYGELAQDTLKKTLAVKAKTAQPMSLEVSVSRLAPLIPVKESGSLAKKAFKTKGSDKVKLSLSADKTLELRLSIQTQVLAFGGLLDKARKAAETDQ